MNNFTLLDNIPISVDVQHNISSLPFWVASAWHLTYAYPLHSPEGKHKSVDEYCDDVNNVWTDNSHYALKYVTPFIFKVMNLTGKRTVGRCNLSKMLQTGYISVHTDHGKSLNDFKRYHVTILNETAAVFCCGDESFTAQTGDIFSFNNTLEHSVWNTSGDGVRITLAIDLK